MLEHAIREEFDLYGIPIRLSIVTPPNPYGTRALGNRKPTESQAERALKKRIRAAKRPTADRRGGRSATDAPLGPNRKARRAAERKLARDDS